MMEDLGTFNGHVFYPEGSQLFVRGEFNNRRSADL